MHSSGTPLQECSLVFWSRAFEYRKPREIIFVLWQLSFLREIKSYKVPSLANKGDGLTLKFFLATGMINELIVRVNFGARFTNSVTYTFCFLLHNLTLFFGRIGSTKFYLHQPLYQRDPNGKTGKMKYQAASAFAYQSTMYVSLLTCPFTEKLIITSYFLHQMYNLFNLTNCLKSRKGFTPRYDKIPKTNNYKIFMSILFSLKNNLSKIIKK